MKRFLLSIVVAALLVVSGCKKLSQNSQESVLNDSRPGRPEVLDTCVAVRGNGNNVNAHFGALARYISHYGIPDAMAGGSSGTVTNFLVESIYSNPVIRDCGGKLCDEKTLALRAALMMNSIHGYLDAMMRSPEVTAFQTLTPLIGQIKALMAKTDGISWDDLTSGKVLTVVQTKALVTILRSEDLQGLINPDFVALLTDTTTEGREFRVKQAIESIVKFSSWDIGEDNDKGVFLKPGLISFPGMAALIGRVGDFYAGYGSHYDFAGVRQFLSRCAKPTNGKDWWSQIKGTECARNFETLIDSYRAGYSDAKPFKSRIDDQIGKFLPALAVTSVVKGKEAVSMFELGRENFRLGRSIPDYGFNVNHEWVRVGVWGAAKDLQKAMNVVELGDEKSKRYHSLGQASWRTVLSYSPAEPKLARGFKLDDETISLGGWPDLHPTLALKKLGCNKVVYLTRKSTPEVPGDSNFALSVARKLNIKGEPYKNWFSLETGVESSFRLSLRAADAVWCTDWDNEFTDAPNSMAMRSYEAFNSPFIAKKHFQKGFTPYPNRTAEAKIIGCTP